MRRLREFFDTVVPHLWEVQRRVVVDAMARALGRGGKSAVAEASGAPGRVPTLGAHLAEAELIDTATVRAIVVGQQLLDRRGRKLTFRSPSKLAARILRLFGVTDLIEAREGPRS